MAKNTECVRITRDASVHKALSLPKGFKEGYFTSNDYVTIMEGFPRDIQDLDKMDVFFLNLSDNSADYRILGHLISRKSVEPTETSWLDSKMNIIKEGVVQGGSPPNNSLQTLIISSPSQIKIQLKSSVADTPAKVDIQFKGRG